MMKVALQIISILPVQSTSHQPASVKPTDHPFAKIQMREISIISHDIVSFPHFC